MSLLKSIRASATVLAVAGALLCPGLVVAQATVDEDFTGTESQNSWFFYNGACLTAGIDTATNSPNKIPACTTVLQSYYNSVGSDNDPALVGGYLGYLGSSSAPGGVASQVADPAGHGALRFTNGAPYGHNESGAVVSNFTMGTSDGVEITFKTVTYRGSANGNGSAGAAAQNEGADGISFYLLDGCMPLIGGTVPPGCPQDDASSPQHTAASKVYGTAATGYHYYPGIGAFGGSLAYTCSNSNDPHDGLVGGYIGLGVDEWGNFLNGTNNTLNMAGITASHLGDNTATGGGQYANRIGLRGAGNISWASLTNAYGTDPGDPAKPYYPASLDTSCVSGTYDPYEKSCGACSAGTFLPGSTSSGSCATCPANGSGLNAGTGQCSVCPAGTTLITGGTNVNQCGSCPASSPGYTFDPSSGTCTRSTVPTTEAPTILAQTTQAPSSNSAWFNSNNLYSHQATRNTCATGTLWNYGTLPNTSANPGAAGNADLTNVKNTAGIMDYAAIPNAYSVLDPSVLLIANESAQTRDAGTALFYDVKVTKDGRLTFSYSKNGSAYTTVLKDQQITNTNGPLPNLFRFGFAGSTGGSTNIHEIMCFKASPAKQAGGSASVNTKQSSKIQPTTQAYFAFYNPTPTIWTGNVTANKLDVDNSGVVSVETIPQWDASCVLTGGKCLTGSTVANALAPASRIMLSYDGSQGIPFEWANLSSAQQTALGAGTRLSYLRGDRTNEIPNGGNLYRTRDAVLSDIVDSSPVWVGAPSAPYTGGWNDRLQATDKPTEASGQSYVAFTQAERTRLNAVYVGANDGFVHAFRAGAFDSSNKFVSGASTPNDGQEVLAYMPNAVSLVIHNPNTDSTSQALDFTGIHYGHNFYVDATPATGDLFYNGLWHTWLVGGLGAGGAAIYALDITDPTGAASGTTAFAEDSTTAKKLVIGEWNPTSLKCDLSQGGSSCGSNLGNTYGTPLIRRLHNGHWAVIFGNGLGSSSDDAGIYVLSVDQTDPSKSVFYYLSTGYAAAQKAAGVSAPPANGISYATSADLDGDHIVDYVYAGDLQGNVWRFDLTSTDPSKWSVRSKPVFASPGQPITSQVVVASVPVSGAAPRIMLAFGTGQRTQLTNSTPTTFATGQQALYGIWDWDMSSWNGMSAQKYAVDASTTAGSLTLAPTSLGTQTFTCTSTVCDGTSNTICWQGTTSCSSGNAQYGWTAKLPNGASLTGYEQTIFNPTLYNGVFLLNSTIPGNTIPTNCQPTLDTGVIYALAVASGAVVAAPPLPGSSGTSGGSPGVFPQYHDTQAVGVVVSATGTSQVANTPVGTSALVYQTVGGNPGATQFNPPANTKANRLTWIELR